MPKDLVGDIQFFQSKADWGIFHIGRIIPFGFCNSEGDALSLPK
jgi:hypothetical protein